MKKENLGCLLFYVIIGGIARLPGVLDILLSLGGGDIGKKDVHEGKQLTVLLARDLVADVPPDHGQIDIGTLLDQRVSNGLGLAILDAQHIPPSVWGWHIAYRHPCL